jgi:hypothetical protein
MIAWRTRNKSGGKVCQFRWQFVWLFYTYALGPTARTGQQCDFTAGYAKEFCQEPEEVGIGLAIHRGGGDAYFQSISMGTIHLIAG